MRTVVTMIHRHQSIEAGGGVGQISHHIIIVVADDPVVIIDDDRADKRQHHLWVGLQDVETFFQECRRDVVVSGIPAEILAARQLKAPAEIIGDTKIFFRPVVADATVSCCILPADFFRVIRRGIVGDDQLKIGAGLLQNRVERVTNVALPIVDRYRDADAGGRVVLALLHSRLAVGSPNCSYCPGNETFSSFCRDPPDCMSVGVRLRACSVCASSF